MTAYADPFLNVVTGSIDFSPYYPTKLITIILEENELAERNDSAFERFWRVWYTERSTYAPALEKLIIGLRPQTTSSKGIQRFLDYFNSDIKYRYPKVGLDMYILNHVDEHRLIYSFNP